MSPICIYKMASEAEPRHRSPVGTSDERGVTRAFWLVHRTYIDDIYSAPPYATTKYYDFETLFNRWTSLDARGRSVYNIHYLEDGVPIQVAMVYQTGHETQFSRNKFAMKWYDGLNTRFYTARRNGDRKWFWFIRNYALYGDDVMREITDRLCNLDSEGELREGGDREMRINSDIYDSMNMTLRIFNIFDVEDLNMYYKDGIIPKHARKWTHADFEAMSLSMGRIPIKALPEPARDADADMGAAGVSSAVIPDAHPESKVAEIDDAESSEGINLVSRFDDPDYDSDDSDDSDDCYFEAAFASSDFDPDVLD